jgi:hypothetical protein
MIFKAPWVIGLLALSACGGGGGGSGAPPPSNFSYPTAPAYTINQAIAPLVPTISGQVTHYSVTPALPAGLSVNQGDGAIAGTPQALAARTTYTVTASNSVGSASATVSIVVDAPANEVSYASPAYSFTVGMPAQSITPVLQIGQATSFSISPALPAGLDFDSATGVISGTPTAALASTPYTVTAQVAGEAATTSLALTVVSAPLFDTGHASQINLLRLSNNALLSRDAANHWVLWNYATGTQLASNGVPCPQSYETPGCTGATPVDLAGSTVVVQTDTSLQVRSSSTGQVQAQIAVTPAWWRLASDGSYICGATASALTVWSPNGTVLFSIAGNYAGASAYAAPTEILVANGPTGANVIQTIAMPTGTVSLSPAFQGQFQSWFADGSAFFSAVFSSSGTNTWRIYSPAAVQLDQAQLVNSTLAGMGHWYWGFGSTLTQFLNLYPVGSGGSPQQTYVGVEAMPDPRSQTLGVTTTTNQFVVVDLSGTTPAFTSYSVPFSSNFYSSAYEYIAYSAPDKSTFVLGGTLGELLDGNSLATQPRYLGYGAPLQIASGSSTVAVSTAAGPILVFDTATRSLLTTVQAQASGLGMQLSNDGSVLSVSGPFFQTQTVYALPAGTVSATFPLSFAVETFVMSASGTVFGETFLQTCGAKTFTLSGAQLWTSTQCGNDLVLSPDGSAVAYGANYMTPIYDNGSLVAAIPANVAAWIDPSTVVAVTNTGATVLYSAAGAKTGVLPLSSTLLPPEGQLVPTTSLTTPATLLYSLYNPAAEYTSSPNALNGNAVYSLSSGQVVWASGTLAVGPQSATSAQAVFTDQNYILEEPF